MCFVLQVTFDYPQCYGAGLSLGTAERDKIPLFPAKATEPSVEVLTIYLG